MSAYTSPRAFLCSQEQTRISRIGTKDKDMDCGGRASGDTAFVGTGTIQNDDKDSVRQSGVVLHFPPPPPNVDIFNPPPVLYLNL